MHQGNDAGFNHDYKQQNHSTDENHQDQEKEPENKTVNAFPDQAQDQNLKRTIRLKLCSNMKLNAMRKNHLVTKTSTTKSS